jgi:hypothetical protein
MTRLQGAMWRPNFELASRADRLSILCKCRPLRRRFDPYEYSARAGTPIAGKRIDLVPQRTSFYSIRCFHRIRDFRDSLPHYKRLPDRSGRFALITNCDFTGAATLLPSQQNSGRFPFPPCTLPCIPNSSNPIPLRASKIPMVFRPVLRWSSPFSHSPTPCIPLASISST